MKNRSQTVALLVTTVAMVACSSEEPQTGGWSGRPSSTRVVVENLRFEPATLALEAPILSRSSEMLFLGQGYRAQELVHRDWGLVSRRVHRYESPELPLKAHRSALEYLCLSDIELGGIAVHLLA